MRNSNLGSQPKICVRVCVCVLALSQTPRTDDILAETSIQHTELSFKDKGSCVCSVWRRAPQWPQARGCEQREHQAAGLVSPRNKQTHHAGLTEPGGREMKRSREGKKTLVSPTTAGGYLTLQRWLKNYLAFREKLQLIPCWWRKAFLYRMPANTHRRNHRSLPSLWKNWLTQGSLRDVKTISWKAVSSVSPSLHQEMSLEPPAVATWQPPRGTWPGSWTEGPPSIPSPIKYFWWKCLIWI